MKMLKTASEIEREMADAKIERTDNQLLFVQWNICYQLARLAAATERQAERIESIRERL